MEYLIEQMSNWRLYLLGGPGGAFRGLVLNIAMAALSLGIGFVLGCVLGLARLSRRRLLRWPALVFVETARSVPALLLVFWGALFLPGMFGRNIPLFWGAVMGLSVSAAAYQAEIVRAGMLAVPRGQLEAALALGMTRLQGITLVVLPQALRTMIPAFLSCFISLFKDTSVAYIIGVVELTQIGVIIGQRQPDRMLASYACVALGFYVVCRCMSAVAALLDRRFRIAHI